MRKKLNTRMETNPLYSKRVNDQLDSIKTKEASIAYRKKMLDDQKRINYSNEYENIRSVLSHSNLPFQTLETLRKRTNELKALGARAFAIN